jgi:hypothetical protein
LHPVTAFTRSCAQTDGVISVVVFGTYALHWTNFAQLASQIRWHAAVVRSVELLPHPIRDTNATAPTILCM